MKVSNVKGLANRDGPESCGVARKSEVEALTGESAGWVLSREKLGSGCRPYDEQAKHQPNQCSRIFDCYQHGPSRIIRSSRETCWLLISRTTFQMRTGPLISQTLTEVLT